MSLSYKFLNESELYLNLKGIDAFVKKFESLEVREASSSHLKIYQIKAGQNSKYDITKTPGLIYVFI